MAARSVAEQLDQVPLADLGVVEVEHHPQVHCRPPRPGPGVRGPGERRAGVVDGGVQVLQAEDHPLPFAELGDPRQRSLARPATSPRSPLDRHTRQTRPSRPVPCRLSRGMPSSGAPPGWTARRWPAARPRRRVGQVAPDVAGHRREGRTGRGSASMSCQVQSQISTWKPSSSIRRTRSTIGRSRKTISAQTARVKPGHRTHSHRAHQVDPDGRVLLHGRDAGQRDGEGAAGIATGDVRRRGSRGPRRRTRRTRPCRRRRAARRPRGRCRRARRRRCKHHRGAPAVAGATIPPSRTPRRGRRSRRRRRSWPRPPPGRRCRR